MSSVIRQIAAMPPPIDRREVLRYMGGREASEEVAELLTSAIEEAKNAFSYRAIVCELPIVSNGERLDLGFATVESRDLSKNLAGCDRILLLAATVGVGIDRLMARYGRLSPARALCMEAIGSERVEALCDAACEVLSREYGTLRPRFSAGYGDLPLSLQRDIFEYMQCHKHIGLTLNESLLMSPAKSVTAIIGVPKREV